MTVVRTNILALNAHRNMKNTGLERGIASNRLSSGFRINSAADDAAGLAISETMRAQIRGLDQAHRNTQDGIALLQTAEGAMQEINNMVHRIRELAVQAANDTNTTTNREQIQLEIDQLLREIDESSHRVEFNSMQLISGTLSSVSGTAFNAAIMEHMVGSWIQDALTKLYAQTGMQLLMNTNMRVEIRNDLPPGVVATMSTDRLRGSDFTFTFSEQAIRNLGTTFGPSGPDIGGRMYLDRLVTHELMHLLEFQHFGTNQRLPVWFSEGLAEAVHGASDVRFGDFSNHGRVMSEIAALVANPDTWGLHSYSAGYLAVMYMNSRVEGGVRLLLDDMRENGSTFEQAVSNVFSTNSAGLLLSMQSQAGANLNAFLTSIGITPGSGNAYSMGNPGTSAQDIIPNDGVPVPSLFGTSHTITDSVSGFNLSVSFETTNMEVHIGARRDENRLSFQIGANSGQHMHVSIPGMSRANLFDTAILRVLSTYDAHDTLQATDRALNYIVHARARLGAYVNRLEFTSRSLAISSENLSDSESRVRNTDMAREMNRLTMSNILQQASIAMLAQANQLPESMLQLLR